MSGRNTGVPPGLATVAEAWRRQTDGTVVAYMRRVPFDGSQPCAGNETFTADEPTVTELDDMAAMCAGCRFLVLCRDWGLAHERHNYWGGTSPTDRRRLRQHMRLQVVDRHSSELYMLPGSA